MLLLLLLLQNIFKTGKSDFSKLPKWKQTKLKKDAGLFWIPFSTKFMCDN